VNSSGKSRESQDSDLSLAATPQMRTDSIAQLRRAVGSGTYSISAEQVAEKMLQEVLADRLVQDLLERLRPR
jgi:flagellar biosynthesis anti-sigma factor FlgM